MRTILAVLVAFCSIVILSPPAQAVDAPAFSLARVSVAAGLDYSKQEAYIGNKLPSQGELKPSINAAYNLGNYVSLTGSFARGLKSDVNEYRVGFRLRLYRGGQ